MNNDIAIKVENLTKVYRLYNTPLHRMKEALHPFKKKYHKDFYALKDVSFEIKKGETVGIIGKNGSGKSTLLKIITGVLTPTHGKAIVRGRVSALLELGAGFNPEYTGIENIFFQGSILGFSESEMQAKVKDILNFADIGDFIYQPVKNYSSGMFARLAFAVAINVEPDILIVDEALSVGDAQFQSKCLARIKELKKRGVTFLLVTHAMDTAIEFCDKALYLKNGIFKLFDTTKIVSERYQADLVIEEGGIALVNEDETISSSELTSQLKCSIKEIKVQNQSGVITKVFQIFEMIEVEVSIVINEVIDKPCFGINLKLMNDFSVWTANSDQLDYYPGRLEKGLYKLKWSLPCNLNVGSYLIALGVGELVDGEYKRIHRLHYAGEFSVYKASDAKYGDGVVVIEPSLCLKKV